MWNIDKQLIERMQALFNQWAQAKRAGSEEPAKPRKGGEKHINKKEKEKAVVIVPPDAQVVPHQAKGTVDASRNDKDPSLKRWRLNNLCYCCRKFGCLVRQNQFVGR